MNTFTTRTALSTLLLASLAAAQDSLTQPALAQTDKSAALRAVQPDKAALAPQLAGPRAIERVLLGQDSSGAELARGRDWKARFDAQGATCTPFLGSQAARNYPVEFRLEGLSVAGAPLPFEGQAQTSRAGETVTLERGSVREHYALALEGLEQSFVLHELPARGELVLRIAVETELERVVDAQGIAFVNELGGLRYGAATAIDAAGHSTPAATELTADGIEIRVPAEFVSEAVLPLTIDPLLTSFTVSGGVADDICPDVAYDAASGRYLVVWENVFSATDHDVYAAEYDGSGAYVANSLTTVDYSSAYWSHPRVAGYASSDTFLVVAAVGDPAGGARTIQGRIASVVGPVFGPVLSISGGGSSDMFNPDVAGDGRPNGSGNYCVVWERAYSTSDHDILAQWLTPGVGNHVFGSTVLVDVTGATLDQHPSISKTCSVAGLLNIVWEREFTSVDHDIYAARYGSSGMLFSSSTPLFISSDDTRYPSASAGLDSDGRWLLAFQDYIGADWDIVGSLVEGLTVLDTRNISQMEFDLGSGAWNQQQRNVCAGCDGQSFEIAYAESYQFSASDFDIRSATLSQVHSRLFVAEGHVGTSFSFTLEDQPRLVSQRDGGGSPGAFMAVWQDTGSAATLGDIFGATLADEPFTVFCLPGQDAAPCPCGNPPASFGKGCDNSSATGGATIDSTGTPSLASDNLHFTTAGERPTATSILMQGNATTDVAFGQGRRCAGGTLKRLYVKTASGGSISVPGAGDASVHLRSAALGDAFAAGSTRYYMVYYRDPSVLGGCSAASTFNATPTGALTWRP